MLPLICLLARMLLQTNACSCHLLLNTDMLLTIRACSCRLAASPFCSNASGWICTIQVMTSDESTCTSSNSPLGSAASLGNSPSASHIQQQQQQQLGMSADAQALALAQTNLALSRKSNWDLQRELQRSKSRLPVLKLVSSSNLHYFAPCELA